MYIIACVCLVMLLYELYRELKFKPKNATKLFA